jgi:hypothetical protein
VNRDKHNLFLLTRSCKISLEFKNQEPGVVNDGDSLLPVELAMRLINRIIQSFEVTHEPNLTITEQLVAVSIHDGYNSSCADTTCFTTERRFVACRARETNMAYIQLHRLLDSRHV